MISKPALCAADSAGKLNNLVSEYGKVSKRRKPERNMGKSKVMRCNTSLRQESLRVRLNGEGLRNYKRVSIW